MNEHQITARILGAVARDIAGKSPLAKAILRWAKGEKKWLFGEKQSDKLNWASFAGALDMVGADAKDETPSHLLSLAGALGKALTLTDAETDLLRLLVAMDRSSKISALVRILSDENVDLQFMLCGVLGWDQHQLRNCQPMQLELAYFQMNRQGKSELNLSWNLERLLDKAPSEDGKLIEMLVGKKQDAPLTLTDFPQHEEAADLLVRLLSGAMAKNAVGVNILLHGAPGTGKTELARTLGAAAQASLYSVGEADEDGEEPTRWDRVTSLRLSQRILAGKAKAVLLFDEMEDLIGDAMPNARGWFSGRAGSKVFVNRMLENNKVPVIWTSNNIGNIDPAILRRMNYVLKMDLPSRRTAKHMLTRIAGDEQIDVTEGLENLVASHAQAGTVLRVAAKAAKLTGQAEDSEKAALSLVTALNGGDVPEKRPAKLDLSLFESDIDLPKLLGRLSDKSAPQDFSLLLSGPPGTGKTELAHYLAMQMDRPLIVKRASDLLSKWVGETEGNIAGAFQEARRQQGLLLFDEVDSILFDRASARQGWEVTQINEFLTRMEQHDLPFIAATNFVTRLDPAALRRFVFKIGLKPMSEQKLVQAFRTFFDADAPDDLLRITNLTPGDFANVKRQLRFMDAQTPAQILVLLMAEAEAKPDQSVKLGF